MRRLAALAVAFVVLGGCTGLKPFEAEEPAPLKQAESAEPVANAESLLVYYQQIQKMPGPDLVKEHQIAQRAFDRTRSDAARMRLAMVLALPGTPVNDDARALELIAPVAKNRKSRLQGLAVLMETNLRELRRVEAGAQDMQQKLEQLKSLERTLIEREQGGRRK
jgi:hypothetical protein